MKKLLDELKAFLPERFPLACAAIAIVLWLLAAVYAAALSWKIGQWLWNNLPGLEW